MAMMAICVTAVSLVGPDDVVRKAQSKTACPGPINETNNKNKNNWKGHVDLEPKGGLRAVGWHSLLPSNQFVQRAFFLP